MKGFEKQYATVQKDFAKLSQQYKYVKPAIEDAMTARHRPVTMTPHPLRAPSAARRIPSVVRGARAPAPRPPG
eukprot:gene18028-21548_t